MSHSINLEKSYLEFVKFLMLSKRQVSEHGLEHGLTPMQSMTLFLLDEPRPMNSFKTIFNCDASNVTGIIDGLEQKKLVSRFDTPTDRRIKMVKVTPKGSTARAALLYDITGPNSYVTRKLTASELQQFIKLVTKITSDEQP